MKDYEQQPPKRIHDQAKWRPSLAGKSTEQLCSTKFSVNAKGLLSGKIKVYAETIEDAYDKARTMLEQLNEDVRRQNNE